MDINWRDRSEVNEWLITELAKNTDCEDLAGEIVSAIFEAARIGYADGYNDRTNE